MANGTPKNTITLRSDFVQDSENVWVLRKIPGDISKFVLPEEVLRLANNTCFIYAVQQDTQSFFMIEFYS